MALFAWINSSLGLLRQADLYTTAEPALASAASYLKTVDLGQRPSGTFHYGELEVQWQATPIEREATRPADHGGSNFLLSLYEVTLVARSAGRELPALRTRVVNHRLRPDLPPLDVDA
jgi:general secretion pathway protein I